MNMRNSFDFGSLLMIILIYFQSIEHLVSVAGNAGPAKWQWQLKIKILIVIGFCDWLDGQRRRSTDLRNISLDAMACAATCVLDDLWIYYIWSFIIVSINAESNNSVSAFSISGKNSADRTRSAVHQSTVAMGQSSIQQSVTVSNQKAGE